MESTDSSMTSGGGGGGPQLPPGFRFHPTDEELVVHYLKKKAQSSPLPVAIIAEVDLYKFDPWELPAKATFGEQEWYFFTPRDRKYPNGARPNRAATSGYWKATGTDKPVLTSGGAQKVGVKKALVFYGGKPPKGEKTNWIMHEYRLADNKPSSSYDPAKKRGSLRLDDWVLCRIYKKNSHKPVDNDHSEHFMTDNDIPMPQGLNSHQNHEHNLFDEMLEPTRTTIGSSLSLPALPIIEGSTPTASSYLHKRTLPFLYWNEDEMATRCKRTAETITDQSEARTFDVNTMANQDNNSSSMAAGLISQLQLAGEGGQTQAMLPGPLGEGVLRQPYQLSGLNWYT